MMDLRLSAIARATACQSALARRRARLGFWAAVAACMTAACISSATPPDTVVLPVTALVVTLTRDSLRSREVAQAAAEGRNSAGAQVVVPNISWSTSNASVASVGSDGRVTATGVGVAQVIAQTGSLRGEATIRVFAIPVDAVVMTPLRTVLAPGASLQLEAQPIDAAGEPLSGRAVAWLSSDTTRAVVDGRGLVTARVPGVVNIAAISEQAYGTVEVRVSGPPGAVATVTLVPAALALNLGDVRPVAVILEDADGNEATDRPVTWESLSPALSLSHRTVG